MANYSVAQTKNQLSGLIEKALAGEEVIITRRGRPTVALVPTEAAQETDIKGATARLRAKLRGRTLAIPVERFGEWLYDADAV